MRRRLFNAWAAISLVLFALAMTAIFSSAAVMKQSYYPAAIPPICRARIVKLYRGQFEIIRHDYPPQGATPPPIGESYQFKWDGNAMPNSKRIAGFNAGYLPNAQPGTTVYYVALPVWPLAVPFLIAPVWWFSRWQRKRREKRMDSSTAFPVGFDQKEM